MSARRWGDTDDVLEEEEVRAVGKGTRLDTLVTVFDNGAIYINGQYSHQTYKQLVPGTCMSVQMGPYDLTKENISYAFLFLSFASLTSYLSLSLTLCRKTTRASCPLAE